MMNWNWPDNKRIALLLSFDIDAETLWLTRNDINERHLVHMSRGLYATKQGLPRILKMLGEEGLKATFSLLPILRRFIRKSFNTLQRRDMKSAITVICMK